MLSALAALERAWPGAVELPETWPECERLLPHILALEQSAAVGDDAAVVLVGLLNQACKYLSHAGGGLRAGEAAEEVYEASRRLLGPEHPHTLASASNLAETRRDLGDAEGALRLHQEVYEASRRLLGPEHPHTLTSANNLAETRRDLGDVEGALRLHQEVYEARRRLLGPEHPHTLTSANNLADTRRALGDAEGALRLHQEVYEAFRRLLGPEHPHTLTSANNLAETRRALAEPFSTSDASRPG
ncbi:MAG: tetratricopeptide repeat protein [Actinomycetota bacterium]|nr:tetratricopeptide repeat protein [Actinomycetota bacterium]